MALSETVQFVYKATNYYAPQSERSIIWNDPDIGINWPELDGCTLSLSRKICRPILWRPLKCINKYSIDIIYAS
jgi:dTDP-4-dehydrorhamnose 3,5-epimerase-like enzyme